MHDLLTSLAQWGYHPSKINALEGLGITENKIFIMKNVNTTVIDLGIGNLMSIIRGLEYYGAKVTVTSDPNIIGNSSHVALPGDGAFKYVMEQITKKGLLSTLKNLKKSKTISDRGNL